MRLSAHQEAVVAAARRGHVVVEAVPGAGKTCTLVGVAAALALPATYLAHDRRSVADAAARLPAGCTARTIHSVALAAWTRAVPGAAFREDKSAAVAQYVCDGHNPGRVRWRGWGAVLRLAHAARQAGLVPAGTPGMTGLVPDDEETWVGLVESAEVDSALSTEVLVDLAREALRVSIKGGRQVDYDALYLAALTDCVVVPCPPLLLVDEAQDLEPLQLYFVQRVVARGKTRLVAAGDSRQSIYGWRGAARDAMRTLADTTGALVVTLPVSYRLPPEICAEVLDRTGWPIESAAGRAGEVWHGLGFVPWKAAPGTLFVCRRRAPLVAILTDLYRRGVPVRMLGAADGRALAAAVREGGTDSTALAVAVAKVSADLRRRAAAARASGHSGAEADALDRKAVIEAIASAIRQRNGFATVRTFAEVVTSVWADGVSGAHVCFSTIHRAKGAEADTVVVVDYDAIVGDQARELAYVALTRAMRVLLFYTVPAQRERREPPPPPPRFRPPPPDPYAVLGLKRGAGASEVKRAFRELVHRYHPDTGGATADPAAFDAAVQARDAILGS